MPSHSTVQYHHILLYYTITFYCTIPSHSTVLYHHILLYYTITFYCTIPSHSIVQYHHILMDYTIKFYCTIPSHSTVLFHHILLYRCLTEIRIRNKNIIFLITVSKIDFNEYQKPFVTLKEEFEYKWKFILDIKREIA